MRWLVFALFAVLTLALEQGTGTLLTLRGVSPSLMLILAVYIGVSTPPMTAAWAAVVLGALVDLTHPLPAADLITDVPVLGPTSLGFLVGVYVVAQMRGLVFRNSPIVFAAMVFVAGLFSHLVVVAVLTLRGLAWLTAEPIPGWVANDQLVYRFFQSLYTAAVAVPLSFVLVKLEPMWGFRVPQRNKYSHPFGRQGD